MWLTLGPGADEKAEMGSVLLQIMVASTTDPRGDQRPGRIGRWKKGDPEASGANMRHETGGGLVELTYLGPIF